MSTPFADSFLEAALILILAVALQTGAMLFRQSALVALSGAWDHRRTRGDKRSRSP